MQVDLDPAGRGRHVLAVVLRPPALDERHPDRAHLRQLINRFETMIDALRQQLGELSIVKDLQRTSWRYFTHGRGMEAVVMVTVATLDEDGGVRQTLRVHFTSDIVQMHPLPYVTSRVLDRRVPVHITELTQAEPVAVIRGVREAIDDDRMGVTVENFTYTTVQLVIGY